MSYICGGSGSWVTFVIKTLTFTMYMVLLSMCEQTLEHNPYSLCFLVAYSYVLDVGPL
jgi:hypothetical protein